MKRFSIHFGLVLILVAGRAVAGDKPPEPAYFSWQVKDFAIDRPLGGRVGVAERGMAVASDGHRGNCLACHLLPISRDEVFGDLGPPLAGIASRQSVGAIRLHVVDQSYFNPETVMPGFYRRPEKLHRVAKAYRGRPFLSAQQIEDVVAWLATLK